MSIRLFIADTDAVHIDRIAQSVARCPDIRIVGSGSNGNHVLRQLSMTPADLLITDVQLPGLDGIMLLRDLQTLRQRPAAIVCTHFYSPVCVSRACACGAAYFLYKPLDYNRLPEVIRECHRARLSAAPDAGPVPCGEGRGQSERIHALLTACGMPAKLTGSLYLSMALNALGADPALLKNLTKGLYVRVAERAHTTPSRVERAMRNAIAVGCARGGLDRRFGHSPTNRELIVYLLEQLEMRDGV